MCLCVCDRRGVKGGEDVVDGVFVCAEGCEEEKDVGEGE